MNESNEIEKLVEFKVLMMLYDILLSSSHDGCLLLMSFMLTRAELSAVAL
jgi:hypothetical protein